MSKWRLFFYSPSNMLGCALACFGPVLFMAGVIGTGWWMVTLLAYALGFVAATLLFPAADFEHRTDLTLEDLQHFLEKLLRDHAKSLPDEAVLRLQSIYDSLTQALPKFKEMFEVSGAGGREWMTFRQVILNYLPETLGNYLRLPRAYASMHKVGDTGKTPRMLLVEQLTVMDDELQSAMKSLFDSDINQMLVNSKFLEGKFGKATDFLS